MIPAGTLRRARAAGWAVAAVAAALLAVNVAWIVAHRELLQPAAAGEPAPEIAVPRIEAAGHLGAPVTLASLRGQVVVLDFWATWCAPCRKQLPRLDALQLRFGDRGLAVVAVNLDDPVAARAMWDEQRWRMTLVHDADGEAARRYGVDPIPHTVVLDRSGVIRAVHRGGAGDSLTRLVEQLVAEPAAHP